MGNADLVQRDLPNPTSDVLTEWAALPDGRTWGSTAGIDIDPTDGHVWVYDRCGANGLDGGCAANPTVDPILKYDRNTGELLASFGAGLFVLPHGLHVDDDGNVWVTDSQGNDEIGHQVIKFSPEGEVLMTLGVAGEPGSDPEGRHLNEPCDVVTWGPTGEIFVSDGHSGQNPDPPEGRTGRILKYDAEGNFIKQWGEIGFRPGQFRTPHGVGVRLAGTAVRRRPGQPPDPDLRPRGRAARHLLSVQPHQRAVHHRGRHALRHRLRIAGAEPLRLAERRADRSGGRGSRHRVHSASHPRRGPHPPGARGRGHRGGRRWQRLRCRGSRVASVRGRRSDQVSGRELARPGGRVGSLAGTDAVRRRPRRQRPLFSPAGLEAGEPGC